jgi:alkanesulfonate monooxygenase SsuD/methylene tetrahydromethanopterin reductase-like flavin-dependent oxidoreductase (luciferase family)
VPAGESVNRARFRESSEHVRSACPPHETRRCATRATSRSAQHAERVGVHRYWIAEHLYDHGARVRFYEIVAEVRV